MLAYIRENKEHLADSIPKELPDLNKIRVIHWSRDAYIYASSDFKGFKLDYGKLVLTSFGSLCLHYAEPRDNYLTLYADEIKVFEKDDVYIILVLGY